MSDYEDYDYGTDSGGDVPKQKGLDTNTVLQIRKYLLGDYDGPTEPLIETRPEVLAQTAPQDAGPAPRQKGRFPPGHSGNPNGRPKKAFSPKSIPAPELNRDLLASIVRKVLDREMAVTKDGEVFQKTIRDIMFEKQVQKAAQGSTAAARFLHALDMQASQAEAAARAKDYATWKDRKERFAALHARERKHNANALYWGCPHPDDIILGPGHEVKVVGPMSPAELVRAQVLHERSTYWLMLATYEGWMQVRRAKTHPECPHVHAELVSSYVFEAEQQLLPPRLRMARADVEAHVQAWSDIAGRALHDLLRVEAAKAGMPVPPRALRMPFTMLHPMAEDVMPDFANPNQLSSSNQLRTSVEDTFAAVWIRGTNDQ
jgi:hypothetical protein